MEEYRQVSVTLGPISEEFAKKLKQVEADHEHDMLLRAFDVHLSPCDICDRREMGEGPLLGRWGNE